MEAVDRHISLNALAKHRMRFFEDLAKQRTSITRPSMAAYPPRSDE